MIDIESTREALRLNPNGAPQQHMMRAALDELASLRGVCVGQAIEIHKLHEEIKRVNAERQWFQRVAERKDF